MARASEPLLAWLRQVLAARSTNTAALAEKCGIPRQRLRRVLLGTEPMTVDELMAVTSALELSVAELANIAEAAGPSEPKEKPARPALRVAPPDPPGTADATQTGAITGIDPWGNQPEQLFRVAFALGCDLQFLADVSLLEHSGVPMAVLEKYQDGLMLIRLDAAFHAHNAPRYDPEAITLTLSFDGLYECRFPWASIRRMTFSPMAPDPERDGEQSSEPIPPKGRPKLRLVD